MVAVNCVECGKVVSDQGAVRLGELDFCCKEHRADFRTRVYKRGEMLYNLAMNARYKQKAGGEQFTSMLTGLLGMFRDEDKTTREGRQSWQTPAAKKAETE